MWLLSKRGLILGYHQVEFLDHHHITGIILAKFQSIYICSFQDVLPLILLSIYGMTLPIKGIGPNFGQDIFA